MRHPSPPIRWNNVIDFPAQEWTCAYCSREVASGKGWFGNDGEDYPYFVVICPRCSCVTFMDSDGGRMPRVAPGETIEHLPGDVDRLYRELRNVMGDTAWNAAVMLGRKLLMHVAVERGAGAGESFAGYVDHLAKSGVVTKQMQPWINEIREFGNDANHELPDMTEHHASEILAFVTMMLKVVYEFPARAKLAQTARQAQNTP